MKKFLTACTVATLTMSLGAVAFAADPADVAGYSPDTSKKECISVKDDTERIQCIRERARQLLKQKMMRHETKMTRKIVKKEMEMKTEWKDVRVSPRTLRKTVKATKTKWFYKAAASSAASPTASSSSAAASSAAGSSSSAQ